jgi:superfamily II DNA or RNA helicase
LTWKGKKVVLDPFVLADYFYEVFFANGSYELVCKNDRGVFDKEGVFPLGLIQDAIFRFWKNGAPRGVCKNISLCEMKKIIDGDVPLVWKCPIPKEKVDPIPFLVLKDRTGAIADLWMDYGALGQVLVSDYMHVMTLEEKSWEKDLLETGFRKKVPNYYCPMDMVVKTLLFLMDVGWTIKDHLGRRVIRQGEGVFNTTLDKEEIVVRGDVVYGNYKIDLHNVVGAFNRRERFIALSSVEVGLLDFPVAWEALAEEDVSCDGIRLKKRDFGLLDGIAPLPAEYKPAVFKEVVLDCKFQGSLFDYQKKGLQWLSYLYHSYFSGLLADEMGLGKTAQLIAFLSTVVTEKPILIVVPVSLLFHWKKEFEKFFPFMKVEVCQEICKISPVMIVSYGRLRTNNDFFAALEYEVVIVDEAQTIKNPQTLIAHTLYRLKARFKVAVTGTPIENRYQDLWSIFRFIMPQLLGEEKEGVVFETIRKKIRPFILRRTKEDVGLQLPEKDEQIVWVNLSETHRAFYENQWKKRRAFLIKEVEAKGAFAKKMEILELILRLRQICCHPNLIEGEYMGESSKFEAVCNDLEEGVASGHKIILYSQFTSMLRMFRSFLEKKGILYSYLDGRTKDREKEIILFQTNLDAKVFLISLKAGGVGLNLQAADYVFLYDPWWNTAVEQQAIARAHRLGQKSRVIVRKYLAVETIEEKILKIQTKKTNLSAEILDFEEDIKALGIEELYSLLI